MQSALKLLVDCRCVIPSAFIFGAAPVYFVGAVGWQAIAIFLPQRVFNVVDDFMYSCYQRLVLFFFENMAGVKISFYGDVDECFSRKENVLYFSNHQSNVDWVIANMLSVRQGSLGHLRYILKDGLQYIPLYGWYFWQHGCVYVRRKGAFRVDIAEKGLNYLKGLKTPVWLAIFPEGTRYYPHKEKEIASSREYALKQTITPLEQHLTPRSRGFHMVMSKLKDKLDAVYDVTVVYSSTRSADGESRGAAPSLFEYVAGGRNDLHLHLHVKRYPIAEVPYETEEEVLSWLHDRFLEKDRYLNAFHSVNYRPGDPVFPNLVERDACLPLRSTLPSFLFFAGSLVPLLLTAVGRSLYWKVWVFGTLSGYAWMKIRQAA